MVVAELNEFGAGVVGNDEGGLQRQWAAFPQAPVREGRVTGIQAFLVDRGHARGPVWHEPSQTQVRTKTSTKIMPT